MNDENTQLGATDLDDAALKAASGGAGKFSKVVKSAVKEAGKGAAQEAGAQAVKKATGNQ